MLSGSTECEVQSEEYSVIIPCWCAMELGLMQQSCIWQFEVHTIPAPSIFDVVAVLYTPCRGGSRPAANVSRQLPCMERE
jgi:hypothetical protein